jgi:hypothetical protein
MKITDLIAPQFYDFDEKNTKICLTCAGRQKFSQTEAYALTCKGCR